MKEEQKSMGKIKLKRFSKYDLIDKQDFYKLVYKHLIKTNQAFCYTSIGIVDRKKCEKYIK